MSIILLVCIALVGFLCLVARALCVRFSPGFQLKALYSNVVLGVFLLAVFRGVSFAADQTPDTELIKRLVDRIGQLERRVAELEAARPAAAAPSAVAPETPAVPVLSQPRPLIEDEAAVFQPTLHLAGFSDIDFAASTDNRTHSGFSEGQFILHFSSQLSRKVSYFGELSVTASPDAALRGLLAAEFNAEVERSIIRYEANDKLKVSFGRYHTPINYWNTAFHHGAWLQTLWAGLR